VLTIGIAPFFALLDASILPHAASRQPSIGLENILRALAIAIGMQNDLIGLEKDLATAERMNLVTVSSAAMAGSEPRSDTEMASFLAEGVRRAVAIHNWAVSTAVGEWQLIQQIARPGKEGDAERELSGAMLGFIEAHLMWASQVKRYVVQ
jgi:hypothetical protein